MVQSLIQYNHTLDNLIEGWLLEKRTSQSGSVKTDRAYRETLQSFRETLRHGGLDLDSENIHTITDVASVWAAIRSPDAKENKRDTEIAPATYNQRLAIVSSFYTYYQDQAKRYTGQEIVNPIKAVKRRKVQAYAAAVPLDGDEVVLRLANIDRSTKQGKRDHALLLIGLVTGRRASELVGLRWKHIKLTGKKVLLTFEHCKGGKVMRDMLDPDTSTILLSYLHTVYGKQLAALPADAAIWTSFSKQNQGKPISTHTLNDICETYLGTSQIHTLRHTFAVEGEKLGMTISELSARLGHSSEEITSRYLKQARSAENPYMSRLATRFMVGSSQGEK